VYKTETALEGEEENEIIQSGIEQQIKMPLTSSQSFHIQIFIF
jgi:hypothetical protein